jgi:hypothetical protein
VVYGGGSGRIDGVYRAVCGLDRSIKNIDSKKCNS